MKIKENLAYRQIEGKIYIVDTSNSSLYCLNDTGSLIFKGIEKKLSVEKIVEKLCSEYEVEYSVAEKDVKDYIEILKNFGIVE